MSFTRVHTVEHKGDVESYWLGVYVDGSASFYIIDKTGDTVAARSLEPHEDGFDIAICGDVKTWFDKELATGRAKAGGK